MRPYYGKYRAVCRDNNDPRKVGRIRAEVPAVLGVGPDAWSVWAWPSLPPGVFDVPKEGDLVWVEFEGGDVNSPIWTGIWYRGDGETSDAHWQEDHPVLKNLDDEEVDWDKRDHAGPNNPLDDFEHKQYHDHEGLFYSPHRRGTFSASGHSLEFNDHPGGGGYVRLSERFGRLLEFTAKGLTRLRSAFYSAASQQWTDLDGEYVDAAHSLVFQDKSGGVEATDEQFIEMRDMAGASLRLNSTPGDEYILLADVRGQKLFINTTVGEERVVLESSGGQRVELDPNAATVKVSDSWENYILMADGKVTIYVPTGSKVNIGGEGGQQLATKAFVEQQYNTHTHLSGSPGSPTSPPMARSPLAAGNDITKKQWSE